MGVIQAKVDHFGMATINVQMWPPGMLLMITVIEL